MKSQKKSGDCPSDKQVVNESLIATAGILCEGENRNTIVEELSTTAQVVTTSEDSGAISEAPVDAIFAVHIEEAYTPESPVLVESKKYDISMETRAIYRVSFALVFLCSTAIIIMILFVSGMFYTSKTVNRNEFLHSLVVKLSGEDPFTDPKSPHSKALKWMQSDDQIFVPLHLESRLIQRYASAVILYSFEETTFMNTTRHECDWNAWGIIDDIFVTDPIYSIGFHCRNNSTISDLNLYNFDVDGTIASEIGYLENMTGLLIGGNPNLRSTIPTEMGKLTNLKNLAIGDNDIYGEIPRQIRNAKNIEIFIMHGNRNLSDNVEPICALPNLQFFSTDCGNGTSKDTYSCVTACCNPDLLQCCNTDDSNACWTTDPNAGF